MIYVYPVFKGLTINFLEYTSIIKVNGPDVTITVHTIDAMSISIHLHLVLCLLRLSSALSVTPTQASISNFLITTRARTPPLNDTT